MIFHKHKLVFVGIPKNASTSIYEVLWSKSDREHNHATMLEEYEHQDYNLINSYHSFSVVRNPYERAASAYRMMKHKDSLGNPVMTGHLGKDVSFKEKIQEFHMRGKGSIKGAVDIVWYPQYHFVCFKQKILVDELLRFENLNDEWREFATKLNERNPISGVATELHTSNQSPGEYWRDYYDGDEELYDMVYHLYEEDFKLFGYER